jgi:phage terminase small subunit
MKSSDPKGPRPPAGYTPEARKLWRDVLEGWSIDPAAMVLLDGACTALMRVRQAQAMLATAGIVSTDRFGQVKAHPAVIVEQNAKQTLLQSLKALNLDLEPLRDRPGRPPGRY